MNMPKIIRLLFICVTILLLLNIFNINISIEAAKNKAVNKDNYDQDEFDIINDNANSNPNPNKPSATKQASSVNNNNKGSVTFGLLNDEISGNNYTYEYCGLIFILLYILNFLYHKNTNNTYALSYFNNTIDLFDNEFSGIGVYTDSTKTSNSFLTIKNKGPVLLKDSNCLYKLFVSGRRNVIGCLLSIQLQSNYDLFNMFYYHIVDTNSIYNKNMINFEITLDNTNIQPFIFAIIKKKNAANYKKNNKDLNEFASIIKYNNDNSVSNNVKLAPHLNFNIITDTYELATTNELLDDYIVKSLNEYSHLLYSIHITDQPNSILRASLLFPKNINNNNDWNGIRVLTSMIFYLIDKIPNVRLSSQSISKNVNNRKLVAEKAEKAEKLKKLQENKVKKDKEKAEQGMEKNAKQKKPKIKMIR